MESTEVTVLIQQWANDILVWIGFGTVVGLLAKAIMPGRDPGGAIATLAMGIGGTIIGCGIVSYSMGHRVTPISLIGLAVGTAGAFLLLFFYRLLAGYLFIEGETGNERHVRRARRSRRRRSYAYYDE